MYNTLIQIGLKYINISNKRKTYYGSGSISLKSKCMSSIEPFKAIAEEKKQLNCSVSDATIYIVHTFQYPPPS